MRVQKGMWSGVLLSALAFAAQASEGGTITFRGAIVNETCGTVAANDTQCPTSPTEQIPVRVAAATLTRPGTTADPELLAYALNRQAGVTTRLLTVTYP